MTKLLYDTPSNAANFFIQKAKEDDVVMTQLKLIKILYFAYGWVLATMNEKLFDEPIEAWKYGPVVPSVYHEFKRFGKSQIDCFSTTLNLDNFDIVTPYVRKSEQSTTVLEKVWDIYKHLSAPALVRLSHEKDSPWDKHYADGVMGIKIPDDDIKPYFHEKITEYLSDE